MSEGVWTEVQIEAGEDAAELIAATVSERTGGAEVRDADTLIRTDVLNGARRAAVIALCGPDDVNDLLAEVEATCERARAAGVTLDPVIVRRRQAHEDEWRDVWKQFFRATRVGRAFIVRPSWDPGAPGDADHVIDLDPGRAFGTGGHASTWLCIELAERVAADAARPVRQFLDLGCGSGILSIAAARLWPKAAGLAVDIDPEATACAAENLARNGIPIGLVQTRTGTVDDVRGRFDLVLANIEAPVLGGAAPGVVRRMAPGATVILSGLLTAQADDVAAVYVALGLSPLERASHDEWTALALALRAPAES